MAFGLLPLDSSSFGRYYRSKAFLLTTIFSKICQTQENKKERYNKNFDFSYHVKIPMPGILVWPWKDKSFLPPKMNTKNPILRKAEE